MKKALMILAVVGLLGCFAAVQADQYYQEVTVITTNGGTAYSDALTVAGFLDKVEYTCSRGTSTFTVATFNSTTAIDTLATKQVTAAGSGVIRPRVLGTDTGGTALAGVATYGAYVTNALGQPVSNYVYSVVAAARYERLRIGGNVKVRVVENSDGSTQAITNKYRFYLVPEDR